MPPYKAQHWLPFAYLKHFTDDPIKTTREENPFFYRFSDKEIHVPIESQCVGDYFYSQKNAEGAELNFHSMEQELPLLLDEVKAGVELTPKSVILLLFHFIVLHFRNYLYKEMPFEEFVPVAFLSLDCASHPCTKIKVKRTRVRNNFFIFILPLTILIFDLL